MSNRMPLHVFTTPESEAQMAKVEKFQRDLATKSAAQTQRLMMFWTYGVQITNLMLRGAAKIQAGAGHAAAIQTAIAGLQIAQAQSAVLLTARQAAAAFTQGHMGQGAALLLISAALQSSVFASVINQINAAAVQAQAERYRQQIEAYRS